MTTKYFVISDTHSFYNATLTALESRGFERDNPQHKIILCGDAFDRGPQTRELYNFYVGLGERFIYIRGNHEDLLMDCIADIVSGKSVSSHHFSNGTVKTIADFCGLSEWEITAPRRSEEIKQSVYTLTRPLVEWIVEKSLNYIELGDYIFVHGWVPTINDTTNYWESKPSKLVPREQWDSDDYFCLNQWMQARWTNGMLAWKRGCKIPGKTVVCGHYHCSWGWSHLDQKRPEFPPKNEEDWRKSFEPYIKGGIMAIDACTAYSGLVNCITVEVSE